MSATILLVEDNASNRYLATYLLTNAGFTVVSARHGREALQIARETAPDLVLMDLQMPEMDGYEAARLMRAEPRLAAIPIVAVTSYAMPSDRARAAEMGFAGYLEKPIEPRTFIAEISRFLPALAASPR